VRKHDDIANTVAGITVGLAKPAVRRQFIGYKWLENSLKGWCPPSVYLYDVQSAT